MKHTSERCWGSINRNENMRNVCSSVYWCRFAHFALKSSRRFLQSSSTGQRHLYSTKISVQRMQEKRYCQHALVSSPLSTRGATELFKLRIFPSQSNCNR